MIKPMIILFLLGGLQGLIGWVMVQSGLNDEDLYVSHIRLAVHFIAALGLLVYTFWFALKLLLKPKQKLYAPASKKLLSVIIILLVMQLIYGVFMAGLKAATAAPTWPDINGEYWPSHITSHAGGTYSFLSALINNPIAVHFIHRNLAYFIFLLIVLWTVKTASEKRSPLFNLVRWLPIILVSIQVILGIVTVLVSYKKIPQHWGVFEWNAQLHQVFAMFLLLSLVMAFYLLTAKEKSNFTPCFDKPVI
jgi:cytochrome c oxidase assembly protein subunit 15